MVKGILVNRKADEVFRSQLKMEHMDLIAEMQTVEDLPTHERLQLARLRRSQQLKAARQKEKEWLRLQRTKHNNNHNSGTILNINDEIIAHNVKGTLRRHISFQNSVVLLEAASRNDMQEVAELLQHGISPDAANEDGLTALHQCCIDNNVEMLKLLLQYGANVDAKDSDKWTPLHAAATCGHLELVRILIEHNANLLAVNTDGNMPYDLCDDEKTLDFIEAEMSKRGVTQELIDETRSSTERQMLRDLMEIARNGGDLDESDYQGATPLHIASANGYIRVVEFLLEMHVNVDALDKDLWSPVHAAACWGHLEILEMLTQHGADLNVKNKDDETPSDICEDPEIRERIEQLKTEQESKRLAEAQRRRVRRSQSNNTRAQSVRRTSLRDKTLTTKKDAVEEARLRLQAQEVFISSDNKAAIDAPTSFNGKTLDANGMAGDYFVGVGVGATTMHGSQNDSATGNKSSDVNAINGTVNRLNDVTTTTTAAATAASATNITSKSAAKGYNSDKTISNNASLALNNGSLMMHSLLSDDIDSTVHSHMMVPRSLSDERENTDLLNSTTAAAAVAATTATAGKTHDSQQDYMAATPMDVAISKQSGSGSGSTTADEATEPIQVQSDRNATNGKINVQVTVLVGSSANQTMVACSALSSSDINSTYSINKFSGITSDVVSDSTRSKKCCTLM